MKKDLTLTQLTDKVGISCMLAINTNVMRISKLLNLSFNLSYVEEDLEYIIKDGDRVILLIDKTLLYIKPFEFFRLKSLKVFDDYEILTNEKFGETIFYNSLIKMQVNDSIDYFIYYCMIYLLDYFNLDANDTKLTKTKDNVVVMNSSKYEFVYDDKEKKTTTYKKVIHLLRVSLNTDEIRLTKIYNGSLVENFHYRIYDIMNG